MEIHEALSVHCSADKIKKPLEIFFSLPHAHETLATLFHDITLRTSSAERATDRFDVQFECKTATAKSTLAFTGSLSVTADIDTATSLMAIDGRYAASPQTMQLILVKQLNDSSAQSPFRHLLATIRDFIERQDEQSFLSGRRPRTRLGATQRLLAAEIVSSTGPVRESAYVLS